tara:strand:+ start:43 stop:249 length:207 start_codon:yes stop_codon:yes gene_type:complete
MNIERDYLPFLILGIVCVLCTTLVSVIDISEESGFLVWLDALYPFLMWLGAACFAISWIRWKKISEKD